MEDWTEELKKTGGVGKKIQLAIDKLLTNDRYLLDVDANERSITFRLGLYLQDLFPCWNVDCEYNRDGNDPKRLSLDVAEDLSGDDDKGRTVFPDIVIHKRGKGGQNLLVIEVKKSSSTISHCKDLRKLCAYKAELGYEHALFVCFSVTTPGIEHLQWIDHKSC